MSVETQARPVAPAKPSLYDLKFDVLEEIFALDETPCEVRHVFSTCTTTVRWRSAPTPCGCERSQNACQGAYDHIAERADWTLWCNECGFKAIGTEWLKGWVEI